MMMTVSLGGCGIGTAVQSTVSTVVSAAAAAPKPSPGLKPGTGIRAAAGPQSTAGQVCAVSLDRGARGAALCAHCAP